MLGGPGTTCMQLVVQPWVAIWSRPSSMPRARWPAPCAPHCGQAEGTNQHVYYRCSVEPFRSIRGRLTLGTKGSFADVVQLGATAREGLLGFTRGLIASPMQALGMAATGG